MSSYISKKIKPIRDRIGYKLDREFGAKLEQYCHYLDRDDVIA